MKKQDAISEALRKAIREGEFEEGKRIPPESELAVRFGASSITVNKALGTLVQEGYLLRPGGPRLGTVVKSRRPCPGVIAMYSDVVNSSFNMATLGGALKAAEQAGYMLAPSTPASENSRERLRKLENGLFKGVLTTLQEELETSLPVIYLDKTNLDERPGVRQVRCDSREGGRLIARSLLDAGHREVAYLTFHREELKDVPRRAAYFETMKAGGVADIEARFFRGQAQTLQSAKNELRSAIERFPRLSALSCENDEEALLAMRAGAEMGLDIGGGITLTGFGNLKNIQELRPFATIEQHPEETGYRACQNLIALIENPDAEIPWLETLGVELVNAERIRKVQAPGGL